MADFNSPEEIQQYLEDTARVFGKNSEEYVNALKDAEVGIRGYTQNLRNSMQQLGTSFKALGADMYKGTQGVGQFGGAIEASAGVVKAYTDKFSLAGKAVGHFAVAVAKFAQASLKMSDQLFESYQQISRAGVVGASAMEEVYDDMKQFGYTIDQLGEMGSFLVANSKALGQFGKSAIDSKNQLVGLAGAMQQGDVRRQLFNLGMNVTDINQASAGYLLQLARLGQATKATSVGNLEYIKEMETLTRLTGMTRQEMEQQREQAENVDAFFAMLEDMPDPKVAEKIRGTFNLLMSADPTGKRAMAFAETMGTIGIPTSPEAMEFLQGTGFKALEVRQKLLNNEYANSLDAAKALGMGFRDNHQLQKDLARVQANYGGSLKSSRGMIMLLDKNYEDVRDTVENLAAGGNKLTDSQAKTRDSQIRTAQNLQDFVRMGVGPATKALEIFTEAVEYLTGFIPGFESKAAKAQRLAAAQASARPAAGEGPGTMGGIDVPTAGAAEAPTGTMGLKLKAGAEIGGKSSDALYAVAQAVAEKLGGDYKYFSGFNDGRSGNTRHAEGRAFDLVLNDPAKYASVAAMIQGMPGVSLAQFEPVGKRNPNGTTSTGDHIHTEISAAAGAILSGPMGGYRPNLTMHGTEAVVPLNTPAQQAAFGGNDAILSAQLDRLDELVSVMKNQLGVSTKIMQMSH